MTYAQQKIKDDSDEESWVEIELDVFDSPAQDKYHEEKLSNKAYGE